MGRPLPHRLQGVPIADVSVPPLVEASVTSIGATASRQSVAHQTGKAGAPNLPTETGWGGYTLKAPLCRECGKSIYQCFCGEWAGDDQMMSVADMKLAMPELFEPNDGSTWQLAERSALGMPGVAK